MTDQKIINAFQSGNERKENEAFKYINKKYKAMGISIMRNKNIPEHAQDDLYADSLIIFYQSVQKKTFEKKSKLSTFFYSICHNITSAYFRSQERNTNVIEEYYRLMDATTIYEDLLSLYEFDFPSEEKLLKEVESLGEPCHGLITGYYYYGESLRELAIKYDYKNDNTVKQAKHKCINRLKKRFNVISS